MAEVSLTAQKREVFGSRNSRKYRREGKVPGIFYFHGEDSIPLLFDHKQITYFLHHAHGLVQLQIAGEEEGRKCVLKDVQYNPVTEDVVHVDFQGVKMSEKIQLTVPLAFKGTAAGIKSGGIMATLLRDLTIKCLPGNIPNNLEVDVSNLEIGHSIHISDLHFENIEIMNDPNETVVLVELPKRAYSEMEEAVVSEEVIGEETEEKTEEQS